MIAVYRPTGLLGFSLLRHLARRYPLRLPALVGSLEHERAPLRRYSSALLSPLPFLFRAVCVDRSRDSHTREIHIPGLIAWIKLALCVAVLVPSVYIPRFFCRYLCPMGTLLEPLSSYKVLPGSIRAAAFIHHLLGLWWSHQ